MYYQNYEDYMRSILGYPNYTAYNDMHSNNTNYNDTYSNYSNTSYQFEQGPRYSTEILDLYPEIYKIVNPMVCKICEVNTKPITQELIEQMTDEIYMNLESDNYGGDETVNIKVNIGNDNTNVNNDRTKNVLNSQGMDLSAETRKNQDKSSRNNMNTRNYNTKNEDVRNNVSINKNCKTDSRIISSNRNTEKDNSINSLQEKNLKMASDEKTTARVQENRQIRRRNNTLRDLIKILILNRLLDQSGHWRPQRPPMPPRPPRPMPPPNRPPY